MQLEPWGLFFEAVQQGSLSKVAIRRGTTQSQVSRQIQELERQIGARLFDRTGRGVTVTEFGAHIVPQVRAMLTASAKFEDDIKSAAGQIQGRVRVGMIPSLADPFMLSVFAEVATHYPGVFLSIREEQGARLERELEQGELDLAVLYRHEVKPHHPGIVLAKTDTYLVGPIGDVLTNHGQVKFKRLHSIPLVGFCQPSHWRDLLDQQARKKGIALNYVLEADSLGLQLGLVAIGKAYALLGHYAIRAAVVSNRLQIARVVEPKIERTLVLELPRVGRISPATKVVMQIAERLAEAL